MKIDQRNIRHLLDLLRRDRSLNFEQGLQLATRLKKIVQDHSVTGRVADGIILTLGQWGRGYEIQTGELWFDNEFKMLLASYAAEPYAVAARAWLLMAYGDRQQLHRVLNDLISAEDVPDAVLPLNALEELAQDDTESQGLLRLALTSPIVAEDVRKMIQESLASFAWYHK